MVCVCVSGFDFPLAFLSLCTLCCASLHTFRYLWQPVRNYYVLYTHLTLGIYQSVPHRASVCYFVHIHAPFYKWFDRRVVIRMCVQLFSVLFVHFS